MSMQAADKEEETKRGASPKKAHKTKVNQNVVCREREFGNENTHKDIVTGIAYINESEFLTCS